MAKMMKYFLICAAFYLQYGLLQSQNTYELFPEWEAVNDAGRIFVCIPKEDSYFLLSEILDTIPGSNQVGIISLAAEMGSQGEQLLSNKFINSDSIRPYLFRAYNAKVGPSKQVYTRVIQFPDEFSRQDYFVAYDFTTNSFVQSIGVSSADTGVLDTRLAFTHYLASGGYIHIAAVAHYQHAQDLLIVETDSLFNESNRVTYRKDGFSLVPNYVNKTAEGRYEIMGWMRENEFSGSVPPEFLFYLSLNTDGSDAQFKVLETPLNLLIGLADAYLVHRESSGDFILSASDYVSCGNPQCINPIPYMLRISPEFDSIVWQRKLFNIDDDDLARVVVLMLSLTKCEDSSGYLGLGFQSNTIGWHEFPTSAFLYKVNNNGDSLWVNHYRPLSWDSSYIGNITLYDIEAYDEGTYLMAGYARDTGTSQIRPYVLRVDSEGCLVPGCHEITSLQKIDPHNFDRVFKVFPNPAVDYLYMQCIDDKARDVVIRLVTITGHVLHTSSFDINFGYQYSLPLNNIPSGTYILQINDQKGGILQTEKLIIH
ncbi:MAG: hypothetical protein DRI69_08515 [Bacteroidetes bacterium]|nr:MAG: hypothetical protein DRI69_08515 [Bacteroidota bacterium]